MVLNVFVYDETIEEINIAEQADLAPLEHHPSEKEDNIDKVDNILILNSEIQSSLQVKEGVLSGLSKYQK